MKTKTIYPPLTKDDILLLRGQPMSERIEPSHVPIEEWIYYQVNTNIKERYVFKKGQLISWKKELI